MKKLLAMILALVLALSMLTMAVFAEHSTEEEETENVPEVIEPEEEVPATGLALAVVPAVLAMAVAVISKRR